MATVVAENIREVLEVEDCVQDVEAGTERLSVCENSLYYTDETTESHLKNKKVEVCQSSLYPFLENYINK